MFIGVAFYKASFAIWPKSKEYWQGFHSECCVMPIYVDDPSSIYSKSIGHILEQEFFCLGRLGNQGSKEKRAGFEEFWATIEGGFFNFLLAKIFFKRFKKIF